MRRAQQAEREEALGEEGVEEILEDDALLHKRARDQPELEPVEPHVRAVPARRLRRLVRHAAEPLFPGIPVAAQPAAAAGASGSGGSVAGEGGGRPVIVVERRVLARVDQPLEEGTSCGKKYV